MARLLEENRIKGLSLENRMFRSATWEGLTTADGKCTDQLVAFLSGPRQRHVGPI